MRKDRMFRPPPTHRAAVAFENRHADRKHNPAIASHRASNPAFTCISACMSSSPENSASAKPASSAVTTAMSATRMVTITPTMVSAMRVRLFGVASRYAMAPRSR